MNFTSFGYLWLIAAFTPVYWMAAKRVRLRNLLLVLVSYFIYGFLNPWYCLLLFCSSLTAHICGQSVQNPERKGRAIIVAVSVAVNIGMLAFFKYEGFFATQVAAALTSVGIGVTEAGAKLIMPIGISFYTLQAVGFTVDAYRAKIRVGELLETMAYLSFFPKLIAGPLEPAETLLPQLQQPKDFQVSHLGEGTELMLYGLFKKLVVAENIRPYIDQIFLLKNPSATLLAVGAAGFTIQILADFSGYTDIARGSARLLGFTLMENFRLPYLAISPSDFWRRWHISLSQWFRDYVYIPLGGSEWQSRTMTCIALMTTMMISGLWHGVTGNFLLWGLYHGLLLCAYTMLGMGGSWSPRTRLGRAAAWLTMTIFTVFGWLLFRSPGTPWFVHVMASLTPGLTQSQSAVALVWLGMYALYVLPWVCAWTLKTRWGQHPAARALSNAIVALSIVYLSIEVPLNFVYYQF